MNWTVRKLGEVCEINIGRTPSRSNNEYWESGTHHWLSIADMSQGVEITDTKEKITESAVKACNCKIVPANTVLMSFKLSIGKLGINKIPLYTNEAIAALPIKDERILHQRYLLHYLKTVDFARSVDRAAKGLTLNKEKLKQINIALPPLAEQQRIAELLDTADRILKQRESAIAKLETLANSIFIEMFSHLIADPKSQVKLKQVCKKITDGTHQSPKWEESGIPFLFISNIVNSEITFETHKFISLQTYEQLTKSTPISINDILFTTVGSYGNVAIVKNDKKFCFQRHIAHIKPDANKVTTIFLAAMLRTHHVKQQVDRVARGVAQKTVNLGDLRDISVICPTLEDQHMFNKKIEAIEAMRYKFYFSLSNLKKINSSIQDQSFAVN